jgi:transaldolase
MDGERMLAQGLQIAAMGENVMVKIPGSKTGYEVIEELTARGISTNNTTAFTVSQYQRGMKAVANGRARAQALGINIDRWRSVITHMSARLGNIGDLSDEADLRGLNLSREDIQHGEIAVLKRGYHYGRDNNYPSKMLQCSMRVYDDAKAGTASSWHIEKIAGGDFVYTCPPSYVAGLMHAEDRLKPFDAHAIDEEIPSDVLERLLKLPYFRRAYEYDGLAEEEFVGFGAFAATAAEFAKATRRTVDFVAMAMEG